MAMAPSTVHLLGFAPNRPEPEVAVSTAPSHNVPAPRTSRRATSHYNAFQTLCSPANDNPPAYNIAVRQGFVPSSHPEERRERLPKYTCSVNCEMKFLLQLESINPLHPVSESEWRDVYAVVRGTMLSVYRVKDGGAGRLLRSYTLQHAEVGMATDSQHTVLIPQTRLAHLIPSAARKKAWQKDPDLFQAVRQHILRLRIETDQILLADSSEDRIHAFINAVSAGIDIAHAIDERTVPRQSTVPRRRQRRRPEVTGNLTDPELLAEQERILRNMYPAFAQQGAQTARPGLERATTEDVPSEPMANTAREEDELDLAVMREDFATPHAPAQQHDEPRIRPGMLRQTTSSSVATTYSAEVLYATAPENFTTDGKWRPPHPRTAVQIQRYTRRCMPILLAEAIRASDVLICNGRRVKINWRMELLEEWELKPPSYKSHDFSKPSTGTNASLQRTNSQNSQSASVSQSSPTTSRSVLCEQTDLIEPVDTSLAHLELSKSITLTEKRVSTAATVPRAQSEAKQQEARQAGGDMHGVVFCF
ncbi:hypothetical protein BAUCODRAFT_36042 [Baudoinia panamericana UAMH 10762]|uniref:Uncharacterized protein n=1 Tax=Baudoinia panamericana (strain UAMH 10762) TaxID=717646 RepID=M2LKI0_BAUPA|nr:uncharacterized protein BAUCODRAFT_36042 [Baudoinia panamericana UAMH 10762]EMC94782.1 hypothetical protein BAUCODRAFT_36042 [Baudoinia panamericana UAMH 10762]